MGFSAAYKARDCLAAVRTKALTYQSCRKKKQKCKFNKKGAIAKKCATPP
jgi:hypothetical protein